jgi:hypothetical protein
LTGIAAAAVVSGALILGTAQQARAQAQGAQPAAQPERKPKDSIEYDLINAVIKDLNPGAPDPKKALADLDAWTQKYPQSDYRDNDRLAYYLQAYFAANQPDKALEYGGQLMAKDLSATFKEPLMVFQVLYRVSAAGGTLLSNGTATPEQLALTEKAARALQQFLPTYFAPANKPAGATDAQWEGLHGQMDAAAKQTLLLVAYYPFNQALKKDDVPGAEDAYAKAVSRYSDNAMAAYALGADIIKTAPKDPDQLARAIYFIARAVTMDPSKGGIADAATRTKYDAYLEKIYKTYHGDDDGLDQLKQQSGASILPPVGFKIETAGEVAAKKEEEFKAKYPELALWMSVKKMLAAPDGETYFASMKDEEISGLKGVVVAGTPECNPKDITVAIPEPGQTGPPTPEITLKLEAPIKGKPAAGQEIKFHGQASAFTRDPFMLTLNVDKDDTPEFQTDACTPPPPAKKAVPKKPGAPVGKKK